MLEQTPSSQPATRSQARQDESRASHELIGFLERDQYVLDKSRPVPRLSLGARANVALWGLRAFAGVVSAMVVYTFISQVAG